MGHNSRSSATSPPHTGPEEHSQRLAVLRALWRGRFRILTCALIGAALGAWYLLAHPISYTSRAIVLFNGQSPPIKDGPVMLGEVAPGPASLRLLATSSDILDRIIVEQALYAHYRIDTSTPFFHEEAMRRLRSSIEVLVLEDGSIGISASDLDRNKAVDLANAVFDGLSKLVQLHSEAYYARQVALHSGLIADQEKQIRGHLAMFEDLAARLGPVLHARQTDGTSQALDLQKDLAEATAKLSQDYGAIRMIGQNMEMLAAMHRDGLLGTLTLVERPMVDLSTQPRSTMILGIGVCFVLCLIFCSLMVGIWTMEEYSVQGWMGDLRKARRA